MPRVHANLSDEAHDALVRLSDDKNVSRTSALTTALELADWVAEVRSNGGKILVEQDGQQKEVILFPTR